MYFPVRIQNNQPVFMRHACSFFCGPGMCALRRFVCSIHDRTKIS